MKKISAKTAILALCVVASVLAIGVEVAAVMPPPAAAELASAHAASAADAVTTKAVLTVTATHPRLELLPLRITAHGNIEAWQEARLGTEADGLRLTEVKVNVGDRVGKGQVLAVFAADTLQAELNLSRAERAEALALYSEARADLKRTTELQATGALSSQQIQRFITASQTTLARLDAARAKEQNQQLRLAQTRVLAPDHGIISARSATVGAVLPAGQELFRLIRAGRLEWRAEVSSDVLAKLKPGQLADIRLADGSHLQGKLRIVSPVVDTQSRNALVYVDLAESLLENATSNARPGMFARGEFILGASQVLTLPQSAVQLRDGFSYVLQIGADSKVIQTKVSTGRRTENRIEITTGLSIDERVVTTGGAFLGDGDLVKVVANPDADDTPTAMTTEVKSTTTAAVGPRSLP
ncbi:efflux RND transporter periplasmic adaptor subunit [Rheinheimera riviphila]|uniref:Efflux RND transporter periplasmic adaptor subunit n=1 Tax=Rheinheimera riviphila TaxID=1834037 RepID=A0A437QG73_9GAMM|nr:efflux RND transporter periplasmic adaptor subunit [Rheinheimera riviphila]RVU33502.1 efflux RND transporter periplasmic adaptor subunit [Rheinheimera riviphila]